MAMDHLPIEILKQTAAFLSPFDVIELSNTSKKLHTHLSPSGFHETDVPHRHDVNSPYQHDCSEGKDSSTEATIHSYDDFDSLSNTPTPSIIQEGPPLPPTPGAASSSRIDFIDASGLFMNQPMAVSYFADTANASRPCGRGYAKDEDSNNTTGEEPQSTRPRIDFTDASDLFTNHPMAVSYFQSCIDIAVMSFDEDSVPPNIYVFEEY